MRRSRLPTPNPFEWCRAPVRVLFAALLLGACGEDPRNLAATELLRLDEAMQEHQVRFGRFPESLDAARPLSATNLPYEPEGKVTVSLQATRTGYSSGARHSSWQCWMTAGAIRKTVPDCYPVRGGSPSAPSGAPGQIPGVMQPLPKPSER